MFAIWIFLGAVMALDTLTMMLMWGNHWDVFFICLGVFFLIGYIMRLILKLGNRRYLRIKRGVGEKTGYGSQPENAHHSYFHTVDQ